jgi:2-polyprenyl-3-methyl-5-hydroxy-6-metoxy-1,4-benzoquinol methylase
MPEQTFSYVGSELELFHSAQNWKSYYGSMLQQYLGNSVLEVGAGIGGTTEALCKQQHKSWVCLEPDEALCDDIHHLIAQERLPHFCQVVSGDLRALSPSQLFDSILYVDVLEHIEHDRKELAQAIAHLGPGGHLIVLAPAHNWLFSPFDESVGHYRRYSVGTLLDLRPHGLKPVMTRYLDSCGTCLSLANRLLLKRSNPTVSNIKHWDKFVVPLSRLIDRLLRYKFGKTVLVVWEKPPSDA